jgi:hypothetical protein
MFDVFFICMFGMLLVSIAYFYYTGKLKKHFLTNNRDLFLYLEFDKGVSENSISKSLKFFKFIFWEYKSSDLNVSEIGIIKKVRVTSFFYLCIFVFYLIYFFNKY